MPMLSSARMCDDLASGERALVYERLRQALALIGTWLALQTTKASLVH